MQLLGVLWPPGGNMNLILPVHEIPGVSAGVHATDFDDPQLSNHGQGDLDSIRPASFLEVLNGGGLIKDAQLLDNAIQLIFDLPGGLFRQDQLLFIELITRHLAHGFKGINPQGKPGSQQQQDDQPGPDDEFFRKDTHYKPAVAT
jgi:hypothetical protein